MSEKETDEFHLADNPFKYIPHVTLREAWEEVISTTKMWGCLMILLGIFYFGYKLFGATFNESLPSTGFSFPKIPLLGWYFLAFVVLTWFGRGEVIHHRIPKLGFWTWLTQALVLGVFFMACHLLSDSIGFAVIFYSWMIWLPLVDKLNTRGYENMQLAATMQDEGFTRFMESEGWKRIGDGSNVKWVDLSGGHVDREGFISMMGSYNFRRKHKMP